MELTDVVELLTLGVLVNRPELLVVLEMVDRAMLLMLEVGVGKIASSH